MARYGRDYEDRNWLERTGDRVSHRFGGSDYGRDYGGYGAWQPNRGRDMLGRDRGYRAGGLGGGWQADGFGPGYGHDYDDMDRGRYGSRGYGQGRGMSGGGMGGDMYGGEHSNRGMGDRMRGGSDYGADYDRGGYGGRGGYGDRGMYRGQGMRGGQSPSSLDDVYMHMTEEDARDWGPYGRRGERWASGGGASRPGRYFLGNGVGRAGEYEPLW
jgi:hypothetical protein